MTPNQLIKQKVNSEFCISHDKSYEWTMNSLHFHDGYEILFTLSDDISYFVGERLYHGQKNDLLVYNNLDLHMSLVPIGVEYDRYVLSFDPEIIRPLCSAETDLLEVFTNRVPDFSHKVHLTDNQTLQLTKLFDKAMIYLKCSSIGADVYRKTTLAEILLLINSFYRESELVYIYPKNDPEYNRVRQIIQYIHENYQNELSLDILSKIFYLSKYHLGFLFKKATGHTINEYIINLRVLKARGMLTGNDLPISIIANRSGFQNVSHFIRTFKKLTGFSPKQYSKQFHLLE